MKKKRPSIPKGNKVKAELQQEIGSKCPFCEDTDVGHFQIHHIDDNPSNNEYSNLILVCPNSHSKITKGDIKRDEVEKKKKELLNNRGGIYKSERRKSLEELQIIALKEECQPKFTYVQNAGDNKLRIINYGQKATITNIKITEGDIKLDFTPPCIIESGEDKQKRIQVHSTNSDNKTPIYMINYKFEIDFEDKIKTKYNQHISYIYNPNHSAGNCKSEPPIEK